MTKKVGILLVNLGSPEAPTISAIRHYLRAFLEDKRVVELPRLLWLPLLYGVISIIRPFKIISAYKAIWLASGSPLLAIAKAQALQLSQLLFERGFSACQVECAMTYGKPSIHEKIRLLAEERMEKLFVLPLYPQYSGTTTGAVFDKVAKILMEQRIVPEVHFCSSYHREPAYIQALANSIGQHWQAHGRSQCLVFSFHGIPKHYCEQGDPYFEQCGETVRLVSEALGLEEAHYRVAFQSRFGKTKWLEPNLLDVLKDCANSHAKRVDVICPGFAADCLETLEEVNIRARVFFHAQGGGDFHYIPALNASPEAIEMMFNLIKSYIK